MQLTMARHTANSVTSCMRIGCAVPLDTVKQQYDESFVRFMHAAFGSPAVSSFANAIRCKFIASVY